MEKKLDENHHLLIWTNPDCSTPQNKSCTATYLSQNLSSRTKKRSGTSKGNVYCRFLVRGWLTNAVSCDNVEGKDKHKHIRRKRERERERGGRGREIIYQCSFVRTDNGYKRQIFLLTILFVLHHCLKYERWLNGYSFLCIHNISSLFCILLKIHRWFNVMRYHLSKSWW